MNDIVAFAVDVVRLGIERARGSSEYRVPAAKFGKLVIVDRREYEQYRSLAQSMKGYVSRARDEWKPLSLAVFGRPGGGKSYGIKQICESIKGLEKKEQRVEADLSQFSTDEDLSIVFQKARDITLTGEIPVVLLDEFDSSRDHQPFGWLRSFLAPMQEGKFRHGPEQFSLGRAILVFVGGINHSFEMLEGRMQNEEFVRAKGPDFVSRLRGHLNVLGVERQSKTDITYPLRRGDVLRGFIADLQGKGEKDTLSVERKLLGALLLVERYRHGTRSMQAIIKMCQQNKITEQLDWLSLPPQEQIEMHVSWRELEVARDVFCAYESSKKCNTRQQSY